MGEGSRERAAHCPQRQAIVGEVEEAVAGGLEEEEGGGGVGVGAEGGDVPESDVVEPVDYTGGRVGGDDCGELSVREEEGSGLGVETEEGVGVDGGEEGQAELVEEGGLDGEVDRGCVVGCDVQAVADDGS